MHFWIGFRGPGNGKKLSTLLEKWVPILQIGLRCVSPTRSRPFTDSRHALVANTSHTHTHIYYTYTHRWKHYFITGPPAGAGMLKTLLAHTHVRELTRVVYITGLYYTAFDIVSDRDVRRMRHSSRFSRRRRRRSITIYNRIYGTYAYAHIIMICAQFVRSTTATTK